MKFARIERVRHFVEIRVRRDVEIEVREIGETTSAFDEEQRNIWTFEHKFVCNSKPNDESLGGIGIDEGEKPWRAIGLGDDDSISVDHKIDVGRIEPEGIDVEASTKFGGCEDMRREGEGRSIFVREVVKVEDDGNVPFSGVFHQRFHHAMTTVDEEGVGFPMIEDGCRDIKECDRFLAVGGVLGSTRSRGDDSGMDTVYVKIEQGNGLGVIGACEEDFDGDIESFEDVFHRRFLMEIEDSATDRRALNA